MTKPAMKPVFEIQEQVLTYLQERLGKTVYGMQIYVLQRTGSPGQAGLWQAAVLQSGGTNFVGPQVWHDGENTIRDDSRPEGERLWTMADEPHGPYYADLDENNDLWCVYSGDNPDVCHAYSSWVDRASAEGDAAARNERHIAMTKKVTPQADGN